MSILATLKCKTGRHSGEWSRPGRQCEITRRCDSCGTLEQQTRHAWGTFDDPETDRCDRTRRCQRCGSAQVRSTHQWGPWQYLNNELNSPQVHACGRCHQTERTRYTVR